MISENREIRRIQMDNALRNLLYRRLELTREIENIDKQIAHFEGGISENEATRQDMNAQAELDKRKPQEPEPQKGG